MVENVNGKYAGAKKESWTNKLCSDNVDMIITDPDYVSHIPVQTYYGASNNSMEESTCLVNMLGCNHMVSTDDDMEEESAYKTQKGKNRANLENEIKREKNGERIIVTHGFSDYGFARAKTFCDGTWTYHIIANGRIEEVQHWLIDDKEYVRFLISDTSPGYIKRETEWTKVFEISELKKNEFVEELLSRYFKPTDSKAYSQEALKDFRSRIYEEIRAAQLEEVNRKAGWYKIDNRRIYYDGGKFPKKEHPLSHLRRCCSKVNISVEEVLDGICKELESNDIGNRLSFLIGYGMVTWLSNVFLLSWNKYPGVMILGREDVCRRYAESCLKMYVRIEGSDIVELTEITKKALIEYVDVLKDDAFVFCSYDLVGNALKLAKAIVAGKCVANHRLDTPIVVLQNTPDSEMTYDDYVTVDLNGFKVSEKFCSYMQELKVALIAIIENNLYVNNETGDYRFVSYEDAAKIVFSNVKQFLVTANVSMSVLDRFFDKLELGMVINHCFCGDEQETLIYMLIQRLEQAILGGKVAVTGEGEIGGLPNPKHSVIVKGDFVYIPAEYLDNGFLVAMNLSKSDFRRLRDALIERNLLDTYKNEKGYTKKIAVLGDRVHVYKLDKSLFVTLEKFGL